MNKEADLGLQDTKLSSIVHWSCKTQLKYKMALENGEMGTPLADGLPVDILKAGTRAM